MNPRYYGVDSVYIFGRFAHGYVGFASEFETWHVVVIVGECTCTAPQRGCLAITSKWCSRLTPLTKTVEDSLAAGSRWNVRYVILASIVAVVFIVLGLYL